MRLLQSVHSAHVDNAAIYHGHDLLQGGALYLAKQVYLTRIAMLCFGLWCKCMYNQIVYYIILYICIFNHRREFAHNCINQQAYIDIVYRL